MPATTKVTSFSITDQQSLIIAIDTAMIAAGFEEATKSSKGSSQLLTYLLDMSTDASFSPLALELTITASLACSQRLLTQWNSSDLTFGVASNASSSITISAGDYFFTSCRHPEVQMVLLHTVDKLKSVFGILTPGLPPSWWNQSKYPYVFIPYDADLDELYSFDDELSPFNTHDYNFPKYSDLQYTNPVTGKIDLVSGLIVFPENNKGAAGVCTSEICRAAANGLNPGALCVVEANHQYVLLSGGVSGLAVKSNWPEEY